MKALGLFRFWQTTLFLTAMMLSAGSAHAAKVLYYYDSYAGTDYWTPALAARGDTVTTVTDPAVFATQITAGAPWDAVVVSENNNDHSADWASAVASYVGAGGRLVLNNWYDNAAIDAATQAASGPPSNQTSATINAAGVAAGLAAGIAANPITLTNTGWGVYSQALTPSGSAVSYCDFPVGSCAVIGNSERTVRLGLIPDVLPAADGSRFLQNVMTLIISAAPPAPPAVVAVPTLSQWGMMALALLLSLSAFVTLRRQRR